MFRSAIFTACFATLTAVTFAQDALAIDPSAIPEGKQTSLGLYLTAVEAHERMSNNGARTLFIDVRSRAEVQFVGMPVAADINVPYLELSAFGDVDERSGMYRLDPNPDFTSQVAQRLAEKGLDKTDMVIVLCRSGGRSAKAAEALAKAGFTNVYSVVDGFEGDTAKQGPHKGQRVVNGWKNGGLPWTYRPAKAKLAKVGF